MRYLIVLMLFPSFVLGQSISGYSGVVEDGSVITITGSGFGADGPTIVLFDNFQRGTGGDYVTTSANVGAWSWIHPVYRTKYVDEGNGNIAAVSVDSLMHQMRVVFADSGSSSIFMSYKMKVPAGKHFPYTFAEDSLSSDNAIKATWLMDGPSGEISSNPDLVVPNWGNGSFWYLHSNDAGVAGSGGPELGRLGTSSQWFGFTGTRWNLLSAALDASSTAFASDGVVYFRGMSEEFGTKEFNFNDVVLANQDNVAWDRCYFPGWTRDGDCSPGYAPCDGQAMLYYDEIYIATGAAAKARVEIGDSSVYGSCTMMTICTPTGWSDTSIDVTVHNQTFASGEDAYVFVVDAAGTVSGGYAVTIGASESASITAPTNLTATKVE